jgi:sulfate adenylyltransferase
MAARELVSKHAAEIGVGVVGFEEMVYLPSENRYEEATAVATGVEKLSISGTEIRTSYLDRGRPLPEWFTRPVTAKILAEAYPPREKQGFCLWFTGLSGAGKSTTAEIVATFLGERGRRVTVLDGDVVRTHLSKGLGFSRDDRDANIRRIGFVAAEIVRHGGAVICATVSPYRATRDEVRRLVGNTNFFEIFVDTPIEVCESRDAKGMYAKARRGEIKDFTGIDDVYEVPSSPEITLETVSSAPVQNALKIIETLSNEGFLAKS